jgi:cell division protein FtsB
MDQPLDLDAIQARCDTATPGPWWNDGHEIYQGEHVGIPAMSTWIGETCTVSLPDYGDANGAFLANARQDVPALLARVRELEAENQQLADHADELTTEIAEGIANQTMLKGLTIQDGQVCLEIEPAREMLLVLVASMRTMLDDAGAENYLTTEATFPKSVSLDLQDGQHPEDSYTLTVQRRHRPTAHDFRRRAEAEVQRLTAEVERLSADRTAVRNAIAEDLMELHDDPATPDRYRAGLRAAARRIPLAQDGGY